MSMFTAAAHAERCFVHLSAAHRALLTLAASGQVQAFDLTGGQLLGTGSYAADRDAEFFTFTPMRIALPRGQNVTRMRTPQGDRVGLAFEVMRGDGADLPTILAAPDVTAIHLGLDGTASALRFDVAGSLACYPLADPCTPGDPGAWTVAGGFELRTTNPQALATFRGPHLLTALSCRIAAQRPGYLFFTSLKHWPVYGTRLLARDQLEESAAGVYCYQNFAFFSEQNGKEEWQARRVIDARRLADDDEQAEPCWGLLRHFESDKAERHWLQLRRQLRRYSGIDGSITEFTLPTETPVFAWSGGHVTMFRKSQRTFGEAVADDFTLRDLLGSAIQLFGSLATLHHLGFVHGGIDARAYVELPAPSRRAFCFKTLAHAAPLRTTGVAELAEYDCEMIAPEVSDQLQRGVRPVEVLITPATDAWALGTLLQQHTERLRNQSRSASAGDLAAALHDVFGQLTCRDPKARMSCAEAATTLAYFS